MVYPNILPPGVAAEAAVAAGGTTPTPHPPRVEYLATLAKHQASVNVVRWSPNGASYLIFSEIITDWGDIQESSLRLLGTVSRF